MKTIHAIFENGVFRPTQPVDLPEGGRRTGGGGELARHLLCLLRGAPVDFGGVNGSSRLPHGDLTRLAWGAEPVRERRSMNVPCVF